MKSTASAALFLALLFASALNQTARGLHLTWDRIEVDAHLDNAGALHVRERMFVTVDGKTPSLERKIATSTDQVFILQRLVREEHGRETEFTDGWDQKDRYMWRDQTLTWWIRNATDPDWNEQPLVYRLDYELRNALAPAWDIPAGPGSFQYSRDRFPHFFPRLGVTLSAWARAPASLNRRYRLEHDVIFPWFSEREREELKYTLRYDNAWRRVHPRSDIGRGTRGSDYRVTQLLDYLAPGWPPAIELWKSATRVGSIFFFVTLAMLMWIVVAVSLIRRWGLVPQRRDRRWFEEHIGSKNPEIFAWQLGHGGLSRFLTLLLGRLRISGVFSVRTDPAANEERAPTVHLRLLRDPATLPPLERLMMTAIFPEGRESGSALLARHYAGPGFSPEDALEEAIDVGHGEHGEDAGPAPQSLMRRLIRALLPWVSLGAIVLLVLDSVYGPRPMELVLACFPFLAVAMLVAAILPQLTSRFELLSSGAIAALVTLVPVIVATFAVLAVHFYRNTPLTAYGSAAVALIALRSIAALLSCARGDENPARAPQKRIAALGARYARRELRKSRPNLDDQWIPHLLALGLAPQIAAWRARRVAGDPINRSIPVSSGPEFVHARPFTGVPPFPTEEEWIYALHVPSEEERREEEAAEAEENEKA